MEMMDVTPEVLHRDTALELLAEIGRRNDVVEAERFLLDNKDTGWTEYSLYWLFVLERQLQDRLYRKTGPLYEMAWRPEHLSSPTRQSGEVPSDRPAFFVLQSTLEIPIEEAERLMSDDPSGAAAAPLQRPASLLRRLFRQQWRGSR